MTVKQHDPVILVDNHAGVYAYNSLLSQYELHVEVDGEFMPLPEYLAREGESLATVFHPDNEWWMENVEDLTNKSLSVRGMQSGQYLRVEQTEHGDIQAVHPDAVWVEELGIYVIDE